MEAEKNKGGRPLKYSTVEELQKAIDEYFKQQDAMMHSRGWELPIYTITGLARSMGVDRVTLLNYAERDEFFSTIKEAKSRVEEMVEMRLQSGIAQTGHIFNLKNNFKEWKDKQEVDNTSSDGSMKPTVIQLVGKEHESDN